MALKRPIPAADKYYLIRLNPQYPDYRNRAQRPASKDMQPEIRVHSPEKGI